MGLCPFIECFNSTNLKLYVTSGLLGTIKKRPMPNGRLMWAEYDDNTGSA